MTKVTKLNLQKKKKENAEEIENKERRHKNIGCLQLYTWLLLYTTLNYFKIKIAN